MTIQAVKSSTAAIVEVVPAEEIIELETPSSFEPVFVHLAVNKVDEVLTRIVYTVDWDAKKKTTINVIAVISRAHAKIIGYMPVAGVTVGACRLSVGMLRLGIAAASLGACKMFGIPASTTMGDVVQSLKTIKHGFVEVLPLAVGAATYLSNYTPSVDLLVSGLQLSEDKWGVVADFCETTTASAFKDDEEKYSEYKPWAKTLMTVCEKSYTFATEGAECIVTCAAWGDIALGMGALVASPYTGGTSLPYAVMSIARGALALGASSLLDLAREHDLQGKVAALFGAGEPTYDPDFEVQKLTYQLYDNCHIYGEIYEAIEKSGLYSSDKKPSDPDAE